jgi:hypothetical protein
MDTVELEGIHGDINIFVAELARRGCAVVITEWVDGAARMEGHLPADTKLAEECRQLVEERKGPMEL